MYAKRLSAYDFRCFGKAVLGFQYPGRRGAGTSPISNVNLILGDNGGGKSSVLRAVAIAVLAPILMESGYVAHRVVRRPGAKKSLLKVDGVLHNLEQKDGDPKKLGRTDLEMLARFEYREKQSRDRLHLDSTPTNPLTELLYDDSSPAFFVAGYGATRRVETGDYFESSARRSRGLRYGRVAGLFEDHLALRPMHSWFPRLDDRRRTEAIDIINAVLPDNVRFNGEYDEDEAQFLFAFDGQLTPFTSLSDGYKAFLGMAGDLVGHLADVCRDDKRIDDVDGIVLIDEIDLHLHPEWQRTVLPALAGAFPRIQFICTTHSPLVASTARKENVFVTDVDDAGLATIKQIEERVFGQSAEQVLLSSYFGLATTRPQEFEVEADALFRSAALGDKEAALDFLNRMTSPNRDASGSVEPAKRRKHRATRQE